MADENKKTNPEAELRQEMCVEVELLTPQKVRGDILSAVALTSTTPL